jgi:hypothetical protein
MGHLDNFRAASTLIGTSIKMSIPDSRMNVNSATQLLSRSTVEMIRDAIADDNIVLSLQKKACIIMLRICVSIGMVWLTFAIDEMDHTCREMQLRGRLSFSKCFPCFQDGRNCMTRGWKRSTPLHTTFADETWFCIKSLLLGHVTMSTTQTRPETLPCPLEFSHPDRMG